MSASDLKPQASSLKPFLITLTTDFGPSSPYVAAMKGVILSLNPYAQMVDLSHAVPAQDIRHAAIVLDEVTPWFPPDTIHVAVVDPGVGGERKIVYARIGQQQYLAPDNGLLSRLARRASPSTIIHVAKAQYWLPGVSATFHGRDIFAPVAAHLSLGLAPEALGPRQAELVTLDWVEAVVTRGKIEGKIELIDSFGNLVSNITADQLADVPRGEEVTVECDEHQTQGIFRTYADQPEMTLIALIGSSGKLELAIVGESAAIMLGVRAGTPIEVRWPTG
ncbi:MAG TPA: SAM-dependent chlorinase/fluorinase [Pirellulales bacterium]|nr:SAM-dependent chlorinase/fluorinase [Pirellulales bacterium]